MEAYYMIYYMMCENPSQKGPCMTCRQCIRIQKWGHPDVNVVVPTFDSKHDTSDVIENWRHFSAENDFFTIDDWASFVDADKSPNINRKQTQSFMHTYFLKPYEGGKKIFFIWGMEFLGKESNRFLKILEEPTDRTYFILVTHDKEALLPTILSRVQQLDVPRPSDRMMELYALEREMGSEDKVKEAIYLADGDIVEMMNFLQEDEQKYSDLLLGLIKAAYSKNALSMTAWTEKVGRMSQREYGYFIRYQLHFIRESLAGYFQENYRIRLLPSEQKAAKWLLNIVRQVDLWALVQNLNHYSRSLRHNANVKILSSKNVLDYKRLFENKVV